MGNLEFKTTAFQAPVIRFNVTEIKAQLTEMLQDYKTLVVTEDTLAGCKDAQKELARVRRKIDDTRKAKKKELEGPIKDMEAQCKELIAMIEEVEKPIKEGIAHFDNIIRKEKEEKAKEIIASVIESLGLDEKYASKLDVISKYTNLTAKEKDVRADVESRALALLAEQTRERDIIEILKQTLASENKRLKTALEWSEFESMMEHGYSVGEIVEAIKKRAGAQYDIENKPEEPEKSEPAEKVEMPQEKSDMYKVGMWIQASVIDFRNLANFLKENHMEYKVEYQIKVD